MCARIVIVYNKPEVSRYSAMGEEGAVNGVLDAVKAVETAIKELKHEILMLPLLPPAEEIKTKLAELHADLIFNLFEGFDGKPETEALVPEYADQLRIPYTGCPSSVLMLALDKARAKALLKSAGIRTPDFQVLDPKTMGEFRLIYPCIVKPRAEDASHGLSAESVVNDFVALKRQVEKISVAYGGDALVEEFVDGREFNASGFGNRRPVVLPISEMEFHLPDNLPKVLTYDAKWNEDSPYFHATKAVCPANITPTQRRTIATVVLKVFRLFGCRAYARVDMRMDYDGKIHIIEVNPNPDISPGTGAARQSAAAGMSYTEFIGKIIQFAWELINESNNHSPITPGGQAAGNSYTAEHT